MISDLHAGALSGADVLRRPGAVERLAAALEGADRVVLLGDTLELRERPVAELLALVRPVFEQLAPALAGKRVTLVPGNHDHQLGEPWLARDRLAGARRSNRSTSGPSPPATRMGPPASSPAGCAAAR